MGIRRVFIKMQSCITSKDTEMLRTIATMLCTLLACLFLFTGYQWETVGYGLNPMVAWPLAMLFFAAPIAAYWGER